MVDEILTTSATLRSSSLRSTSNNQLTTVLSIAGSDSGGGAGIQADLKTFTALGTFGTTAITCLTAQNPAEVRGVLPVDPEMVALQVKTVCDGFEVKAAKTGMLYSAGIIEAVARSVEENKIPNLVVDPVIVATSGARLLQEEAVEALSNRLIPMARVITPNVPELEILWGGDIISVDDLKTAAAEVGGKYGVAVVAKGGHLEAEGGRRKDEGEISNIEYRTFNVEVIDVLCDKGKVTEFRGERVEVENTHGTGCMFSAALAACLGKGKPLKESVESAKDFVANQLKSL